jgi:alginate O-acetyltransferase complex protein AlgI
MVFSSLSFLVVFLPILVTIYFIIPANKNNVRQYILLAFSLLFYGSGEPLYIFLIIVCISISWFLSKYVYEHRKWALIIAILVNVIPLVVTKYAGFIVHNICNLFQISDVSIPAITMPIGISFYTFQVITYIVDLYQGKVDRQRNPLLFALYIMFFPQLIAGPIVKYSEIARELEKPDVTWNNIKYGIGRLIVGLGKKVLIANQAGYIASAIQESQLNSMTTGMTWLCVIAYTIQIYYDFSGYSEMAIGLGSIFGFHFPENFNDPYSSNSISDFWRRWHITLGRFFREYVYIPLGGNRVSKSRWILNIFIVWALTGLWHGASWNFVIWGLYYGALIILEKATGISEKLPKVFSWMLTLFFVILGWGIFMCDGISLRETVDFLSRLLSLTC